MAQDADSAAERAGKAAERVGIFRLVFLSWTLVAAAALVRGDNATLLWLWPTLLKGWKVTGILAVASTGAGLWMQRRARGSSSRR